MGPKDWMHINSTFFDGILEKETDIGIYSSVLSLFVPHESHSVLVQPEVSGCWVFVKH